MIYKSNLSAPDLEPAFQHRVVRVIPGVSLGHSVISDWSDKATGDPEFQIYKDCGFLTHDEAAILYHCAKQFPGGAFLDIGAHTGWTSLHMLAGGSVAEEERGKAWTRVVGVEPMLASKTWLDRFFDNTRQGQQLLKLETEPQRRITPFNGRSDQYLWHQLHLPEYYGIGIGRYFNGATIDGDHCSVNPILDALIAHTLLDKHDGFICFHDFRGGPVQDAVAWLSVRGYKVKVYWTPNMLAVCYKGSFVPPYHEPDPIVYQAQQSLMWPLIQACSYDFSGM